MPKKEESKAVVNWEEQFAAEASEVAALERPAVANIGLRGGIMTYAGHEVPDNKITGIAIAYSMEHTYYKDKFDSDNPVPPDCFAQALPQDAGRDGNAMVPHENVPSPMASGCGECELLKWGSASEGKGARVCPGIVFLTRLYG